MNEKVLQQLQNDIKLRGLRSKTMDEYVKRTAFFLQWAGEPAEKLDEQDISRFLTYLIDERKLKPASVNTYNMNCNLNYKQLPRQKQRRRIPDILSKEELSKIFDLCDNLRDKALLMTVYGSGLRLSEVVNLRVKDIDSESMRIFVYKGKGDRDRFTILSQTNLDILLEYWKQYRPKDKLFLTKQGTIEEFNNPMLFDNFLLSLKYKEWIVYCKPPFANPSKVIEYLGRYTHRVAISNNRIIKFENGFVTFKWRDYRDNKQQSLTNETHR